MIEADVTGIGAVAIDAADYPPTPSDDVVKRSGARVKAGCICGRCAAKYRRLGVYGTGVEVYCPHLDCVERI